MWLLIIGMLIFVAVHLVPTMPRLRQRLVVRWGPGGYKLKFSLASVAALGLIIAGKANSAFVPVYPPLEHYRALSDALMLLSCTLIVAAYVPTNIRQYLRHPMLIGVLCWAGAHLVGNGDLASLILFGGFAAYAVSDLILATGRGEIAAVKLIPLRYDVLSVAAGVLMYVFLVHAHPYFTGVAISG